MLTKTKKTLLILLFLISIFYTNYTFSSSNYSRKTSILREFCDPSTGSGFLELRFNQDNKVINTRIYEINKKGKIRVPGLMGYKDYGYSRNCGLEEAAGACKIKSGASNYHNWDEELLLSTGAVNIKVDAPFIERTANDKYTLSGATVKVYGFLGDSFVNGSGAVYNSSLGLYTFTDSIIEIEIALGNPSSNGFIKLHQRETGALGADRYIEELTFLNADSQSTGGVNSDYTSISVFALDGTTPSRKSEFYFTGALFNTFPSGSITSGTGELILQRRVFKRNVDSKYSSYVGANNIPIASSYGSNIASSPSFTGAIEGCDTISTYGNSGIGDHCTGNKDKIKKQKKIIPHNHYADASTVVEISKKYKNCNTIVINNPGIINSSTSMFTNPPSPIEIEDIPVELITPNNFSFSGGFVSGVYHGATINGGGFDSSNRMIVFATGGTYKIDGLNYNTEYKPGGKLDRVIFRLRNGLFDIRGDAVVDIGTGIGTGSSFPFNKSINNTALFNVTQERGNFFYDIMFEEKTAIGTYDTIETHSGPLIIIPTNNMSIVGNGTVTYTGNNPPYANNDKKIDKNDVAKICYNIEDQFHNIITSNTAITNYQTGMGYTISGSLVSFPGSPINSHLLSRAIVSNGIKLDQKNNTGEAIEVKDDNSGPYDGPPYSGAGDSDHLVTFIGSKVCFNIKSYAPTKKNLSFTLTIPTHNRDYDLTPDGGTMLAGTSNTNVVTFNKPFTGEFNIDDKNGFKVGTEQTMRIDIKKDQAECPSTICSDTFSLTGVYDTFKSINTSKYSVIRKDNERNLLGSVDSITGIVTNTGSRAKLDFILNYIAGGVITNSSEKTFGVESKPYIINEVGVSPNKKTVTYRLTNSSNGGDISVVKKIKDVFFGLKALGTLQGESTESGTSGKTITGQKANFSSIDKIKMRKQIKSNAYSLIKNLTSGTIFNGIKYMDGINVTINGDGTLGSGNQSYDTLIIKDGNLFITGSGVVITKNLGIILIKDDLADKTLGNVYITPDITYLKAIIYADGSLISKPNGPLYYTSSPSGIGNTPEDSPTRTNDLQKQLILKGSLFSRNTIGGAIGAGPFKCPGGSICNSFDEAVQYDLNYIRRGFEGCEKGSDLPGDAGYCTDAGEYANVGFVVEYNSENQSKPLIGFEINK